MARSRLEFIGSIGVSFGGGPGGLCTGVNPDPSSINLTESLASYN